MKGTVDKVEKVTTKNNKEFYNVQVGGKTYSCWSRDIEKYLGKELPEGTTVKAPPEGTNYNPTLSLPKAEFAGKKSYGGQDPHTTAWDTILMQGITAILSGRAGKPFSLYEIDGELKAFHNGWWQKYLNDMAAIKKEKP